MMNGTYIQFENYAQAKEFAKTAPKLTVLTKRTGIVPTSQGRKPWGKKFWSAMICENEEAFNNRINNTSSVGGDEEIKNWAAAAVAEWTF